MNLADIRTDYRRGRLTEDSVDPDPVKQFELWLKEAIDFGVTDPTAMGLATVDVYGRPSLRTVLLKDFSDRGFVFFTNLDSNKARDIGANSNVSLLFPWLQLERQVSVTGNAVLLSPVDVLKYFVTRPRGSQLAAWASQQSRVISSRKVLEAEWEKMKEKFANGEIPAPPRWGGFRVIPRTIEFWQGGSDRLHDRFLYTRQVGGSWTISRLSP